MGARPAAVWWLFCDAGTDSTPCESAVIPPGPFPAPMAGAGQPILAGTRDALAAGRDAGWVSYPVGTDWFDLCPIHAPHIP